MKRIFAGKCAGLALLTGMMALSLTACGGSGSSESTGVDNAGSVGGSGAGSLTVAIWDTYQEPGFGRSWMISRQRPGSMWISR